MSGLARGFIIALLGFALGVVATFAWGYIYSPAVPKCRQEEKATEPEIASADLNATPSDSPRLVSAFEDHVNRKLISKPAPVYPPEAAGISGDVSVGVIIDETGRVAYAWLESGGPPLSSAAVDAAYKLRCKPTLLAGKPVSVKSVVTYKFVLP
jgi:outer membrane biosynthesis protein TonB